MLEAKKYIYDFSEGDAGMKILLGGKGANLAQMWKIGLPVPPGFIITTEACHEYWKEQDFILSIWDDIKAAVARVEALAGKMFGREKDPLLVSVRSGAPVSMPGMMDTILNLGLNDKTVKALAEASGDERFAYDSFRRFIQMFSDVVLGVELASFEAKLKEKKVKYGVKDDNQLSAEALKELVGEYKMIVKEAGKDFPVDPWQQLRLAIDAVFRSWNTPRAVTYRKINNIPESYGTAVSVVTMVFGNLGDDCGTGVCFTRSPSTGENRLFGEYLINAQGEDVVAGIRTPVEISQLATAMPDVYKEFCRIAKLLEEHYKDAQDIEFTVERGKLYILQTRNGKRTAAAAVKVAMDMYREGLIDERTAVERVAPEQVEQLLHPQIDPKAKVVPLVKGLPASPGAAAGYVVFDADEAAERGKNGEKVILVRPETTPDDIHGLFAAQGVVTAHGGMTSHAAVVARGLGKPCVSGAESIRINLAAENFTVGETTVNKNDFITIDGTKGEVILGEVKLMEPQFDEDFRELLKMADRISTLEVWANADTPEDARRARGFGAKGIGLCRTEHMFMAQDRLPVMQDMVVASTLEERLEALKKLEEMQEEDFYGIFDAMDGLPVTVRLLDPPLHEFLPKLPDLDKELKNLPEGSPEAEAVKITTARVHELHEANPMLGFRGCRLGIIYPEIYEMQVRAIFKAACRLVKEGKHPVPDIMIPLVATKEEMRILRVMVDSIAPVIMKEYGCQVEYMVGTMIELPRAAMVADQLAQHAQFFSFGTNDLTQTTFGYSRDDAEGKFLGQYVAEGILPQNPFAVLDRDGVGGLMEIGVAGGRKVNPSIQLGICGEHGGNPLSVAFCHKLGLNYVSCSPFRVPVSRLAAAHSALGLIK
ncbi:MAG TPA: pyruvate, phosphate dikinase [Synergistaceae bacterium]|jgi:pyruvate,orthophosphate dikinase|nr:pyruvate, phosphate dikinase [Synergistaceae bacterium]NLL40546.1 pyruvate, phosphate dikinase [Synergistaceae bacterium]HPX02965.1 pyruvate, phosphate dikinase [Synergistaceae bacterium]HQA54106.1 pyruvate, phosphate dikinase [Synergistaceae bacterium]